MMVVLVLVLFQRGIVICNRWKEWGMAYFFSRFPKNSFLHPYAMTAPTPTRYHIGRKPRMGILRCFVGGLESAPDFREVTWGLSRMTDLVLNGVVAADGREVLRHVVRYAMVVDMKIIAVGEGDGEGDCGGKLVPRFRKSAAPEAHPSLCIPHKTSSHLQYLMSYYVISFPRELDLLREILSTPGT
jgi:hypothetical protein